MTAETVGADNVVDRAISESRLVSPPPPRIKTRTSIPHLILGNLWLFLLIGVGGFDLVSWWIVGLAAILSGVLLMHFDPTDDLKQQFRQARLNEIRECFDIEADALAHIAKEMPRALNTAPAIAPIAVPTAVVACSVLPLVFIDINNTLSWFWLFRWIVAAFGAFLLWCYVMLVWSRANLTPAKMRINYLEVREEEREASSLGAEDQNDIHIIRQIANLESLHRRIDTYTLESALLSALSFSSFISIVLSERNYIRDLERLLTDPLPWGTLSRVIDLPVFGRVEGYPMLTLAYIHDHRIPLICLSLLLCASTFLGVLVARLRFNDGYRDSESLLKVAERINEKEEQALQRGDAVKARVYLSTIESLLRSAGALERGLGITVMHMRFSRNAGIVFFIIALIMCGFFFGSVIAFGIAFLFGSAMVIGYYDRFARRIQRHEVFSQGFLGSLLSPFRRSPEPPST